MVSFVIVSHSVKLAEGVAELAAAMAEGVVIYPAGGMDDGGLGTSYEKISNAVEKAYRDDGTIIIADLGSSVMTAEMVAEDMQDKKITLADCPIAEGAVVGAVSAKSGMSLEEITEELKKVGGNSKL